MEEKIMVIYIYKNNQQFGPFADTAILGWLRNGQLSAEDFACRTGDKGWQPLKNLFPDLMKSAPMTAASAPIANGQMVSNQQVVEWARRNLAKPAEIELRYNSVVSKIFAGFGYALLAVCLLWLPGFVLINAVSGLITKGWSDTVSGGLVFGLISLVILGGLFLAIVLLPVATRRKIAATLSVEGVETRSGQKYAWENLYFLNYKKVNTRVRGNLAASIAQAAVFAGVEKVTVELVFANGKAIIPPLISNQPEILALFETIPAQRRGVEARRR